MHRFLLYNGRICDAGEKLLSPGHVGLLSGWGVFSTIRVFDGVLFAFERHWARMKRDAQKLNVPFPTEPDEMEQGLLRLIEANQATNATLRVVVVRNRGGAWEGPGIERDYDVIAFTTTVKDWGASVRLGLVKQARHAGSPFAGTKMLSWSFNLIWLEEAQRRGYDEVVLLNEGGEVSECTSANIFACYGREVWTPPLTSGCLPGITRELLLGEVRANEVTVREKALMPADLEAADSVFITSTTRLLLPVEEVEGLRVRRQESARELLQEAFSAYVDRYVSARRSIASIRG